MLIRFQMQQVLHSVVCLNLRKKKKCFGFVCVCFKVDFCKISKIVLEVLICKLNFKYRPFNRFVKRKQPSGEIGCLLKSEKKIFGFGCV